MKHEKLILARKSRGFTQDQMAQKIAMEQTTYSRKEIGKSSITEEEWKKIAKVLEVPMEEIKDSKITNSIKNENCTFHEGSVAGVQYVNLPQNVFDIIIKYNLKLEENNFLIKQDVSQLKLDNNQLHEKLKILKDN
jgi:transcriptional regulator with XRE-family HTH domain|nr:helix-turn-helix transcriptional regulator [uncultured Flavobacterium sp.]